MLCCFAPLVVDQQYMWGRKESQRLGKRKIKIDTTCHQSISFASHGLLGGLQLPLRLDDSLPDVLHLELEAVSEPVVNCWCWSACRKSYCTTDTHPTQLSRGTQGCIFQLHLQNVFLNCISV